MIVFFAIFMIGVIAFSDAFSSIETALMLDGLLDPREIPEDPSWYQKYF